MEKRMTSCYQRLSFTNDEEARLIQYLKEHPALWDASHVDYGNAELRKAYWQDIATELNKSVVDTRRKWRFIRDYYVHRRRRGQTNESTKERDGKYFNVQFLDKVTIRRNANSPKEQSSNKRRKKSKKNVTNDQIEKIEIELGDSELECSYPPPDEDFENVTMDNYDQTHEYLLDDRDGQSSYPNQEQFANEETFTEDMSNEDFDCFDEAKIISEPSNEYKMEDSHGGGEEEHLIETQSEPEREPTKTQFDDSMHARAIDLFFESMAAAVKTFPPKYAAEAKYKVFTAINELEMKVHSSMSGK